MKTQDWSFVAGKKKKSKKENPQGAPSIVIDESRGLAFYTEQEVYEHFTKDIKTLEDEYNNTRPEADTLSDEISSTQENLSDLLQEPDEVWLDETVIEGIPLGTFIGYFETEDEEKNFYYIALTYFVENMPKFVFMHFATDDLSVIEKYQRGKKIYDRNLQEIQSDEEAVDALSEGDELAIGLYNAMLKLRTPTDIDVKDFPDFIKYREETIEEPDEIWRKIDSEGRVLISFIKSLSEEYGDLRYVVVTTEDELSESQYLLFSFPTKDTSLVDRYKQGESLDTVSFSREESH